MEPMNGAALAFAGLSVSAFAVDVLTRSQICMRDGAGDLFDVNFFFRL